MFEKVNPAHPDKMADRIAGAMVDIAYKKENSPKVAIELLLGHGKCQIIAETSVLFDKKDVEKIAFRIVGREIDIDLIQCSQDVFLSKNQSVSLRSGDNGIFKGEVVTQEQKKLTQVAKGIYEKYKSDGKYIIANNKLILCQSNAKTEELEEKYSEAIINPLGFWTGGSDVDTGAVNRKLGSDLADSVTGGGIHGKDLSKADVSVNIWCFLMAQKLKESVSAFCAIGDEEIKYYVKNKEQVVLFSECVRVAGEYIKTLGGFEKLAEWGLVR